MEKIEFWVSLNTPDVWLRVWTWELGGVVLVVLGWRNWSEVAGGGSGGGGKVAGGASLFPMYNEP